MRHEVQVLTLGDDVAGNVVSKRQIAGNGHQKVDEASRSNTGHDNRRCPEVRVVIDLVQDGEHLVKSQQRLRLNEACNTYILMASVCKDNDWKAGKSRNNAFPLHKVDIASLCHRVALGKVVNNQDYKVANRDESNNTGVFERVESSQEGQWNDNEPAPQMLVG